MPNEVIMNIDDLQKTIQILQSIKTLFGHQNPWIPVYAAIGGALVGAIAAIFPSILLERIRERRTIKAVTDSIICEVSAILTTIKHRRYLEILDQIISNLHSKPGNTQSFQVIFPDNYFKIYNANLDRINLIDDSIRIKVVIFYQLLEAVIQDAKPGGLFSLSPQGIEAYIEAKSILKQSIDIGNEIEKKWRRGITTP